jgi:hypothetical protein
MNRVGHFTINKPQSEAVYEKFKLFQTKLYKYNLLTN